MENKTYGNRNMTIFSDCLVFAAAIFVVAAAVPAATVAAVPAAGVPAATVAVDSCFFVLYFVLT